MSLLRVAAGGPLRGIGAVPGDKSIAHRVLLLAAMAAGESEIVGLPTSDDVRSTTACLAALLPDLRPELQGWNSKPGVRHEDRRFTSDAPRPRPSIRIPGRGRGSLRTPAAPLDCGNSGTSMRLLLGLLAAGSGEVTLVGDPSLSSRPMERVARPLRTMGAEVETSEGHAPVRIRGGRLSGSSFTLDVPSAQVKGAILLAGLAAEDVTEVVEAVPTRDHTERLLHALGVIPALAPRVRAADVPPFSVEVPGDVSGAVFLATAALASRGEVRIEGVGLNPTRLGFAPLLERMGAAVATSLEWTSLGEPIGTLEVRSGSMLCGIEVSSDEVTAAIDEIPALALLCGLADGPSRFRGVTELRVKESDRVSSLVRAIRALGGEAQAEGDDLVVSGGGLSGGRVDAGGDHRIAMAAAAVGTGAAAPVEIEGAECASVSFPGFGGTLRSLGADVEG